MGAGFRRLLSMSWVSALQLLITCEGGLVLTDPPEGPTFGGILKPYYLKWCQQHGRPPDWPPTAEGHASYTHDAYWTPYNCGAFPDVADAVALQCVFNLPWKAAHQVLQIAVGAYPDGVIGKATLAAIRLWDARELANRILVAQITHYCDTNAVGQGNFDGLVVGRIGKVRKFLAAP